MYRESSNGNSLLHSNRSQRFETKFNHLSDLIKLHDSDFYNYLKDVNASDMFFCYRWLLLECKREFPFDDSLYMSEVMVIIYTISLITLQMIGAIWNFLNSRMRLNSSCKKLSIHILFCGNAIETKFNHLSDLIKLHDSDFYNYLKDVNASDMFFC
jgi:hypothetical protein